MASAAVTPEHLRIFDQRKVVVAECGSAEGVEKCEAPLIGPGGTGPNQGRFGTLGRNTFRGPAFRNYDFALIKDTEMFRRAGGEAITLQMRGEFFNIFNIVNFGLPGNIVLGPGFGVINRTAGTSRQIQVSMKVIF